MICVGAPVTEASLSLVPQGAKMLMKVVYRQCSATHHQELLFPAVGSGWRVRHIYRTPTICCASWAEGVERKARVEEERPCPGRGMVAADESQLEVCTAIESGESMRGRRGPGRRCSSSR